MAQSSVKKIAESFEWSNQMFKVPTNSVCCQKFKKNVMLSTILFCREDDFKNRREIISALIRCLWKICFFICFYIFKKIEASKFRFDQLLIIPCQPISHLGCVIALKINYLIETEYKNFFIGLVKPNCWDGKSNQETQFHIVVFKDERNQILITRFNFFKN